ncbi:hypothetical protein QYE77_15240 (plasmid) [Thermanaerothrix sp. 4228-RoL]|jgi:hypothetical protein|uniref:Uncharacterized protein n=1 Tax=Thermanaerothrix solaris TaxID=3058434 RepID=A0ABU3NS17_9CHLR|nr:MULTISPECIES: hypothetical protein [unclassified Thermanaerothrix]MDT8899619.1 hypothetical protein [Thermanaerothrix sp. 4228-RoL]
MTQNQNSFESILESLSTPFSEGEIEWKPQALSADKKRALAAAYVDMRSYQDRLDLVCPDWISSVQFMMTEKKVAAVVSLTIAGVTRVNVGEASLDDENAFTAAYAQGFKRVCSDFGLGRYLYRLPQVWCDYDEKRRAIIGAPELPDWALPEAERLARQADKNNGKSARQAQQTQPVAPAPEGGLVLKSGKFQGKSLEAVWESGQEGVNYLKWLANLDGKGFVPKTDEQKSLQSAVQKFVSLKLS